MKEIEVTIKLRNNLLKARRIALGLTIKNMALAIGANPGELCSLEGLKRDPTIAVKSRPRECRARGCSVRTQNAFYPFCVLHMKAEESVRAEWLRANPLPREWSALAKNLAAYFNVDPGDLFPDSIRQITHSVFIAECNARELPAVAGDPFEAASNKQLTAALEESLATLTPREADVLRRHHMEGMTADEIGEVHGVTRNRILQIEAKALRKLRHPSRTRKLIDLAVP